MSKESEYAVACPPSQTLSVLKLPATLFNLNSHLTCVLGKLYAPKPKTPMGPNLLNGKFPMNRLCPKPPREAISYLKDSPFGAITASSPSGANTASSPSGALTASSPSGALTASSPSGAILQAYSPSGSQDSSHGANYLNVAQQVALRCNQHRLFHRECRGGGW